MVTTSTTAATTEMEQCIINCMECYRVCEETLMYSVQKGGQFAEPMNLSLLADCARVCALSADFMIRQSERHILTCGICASICEACAKVCEQMANEPMMHRCAEVCNHCADSCRDMSGMPRA